PAVLPEASPAASNKHKPEAAKKFCTGCGTLLRPGAKFCANCGKAV
ncbi:MAG: zinc-ribbon domain-containing protein, partial [Candidatus Marinimicrobia bacterium]|nr:zinc-ribbon domain-containing protein [Candidatus Neomarinimicrobiota bacterium]